LKEPLNTFFKQKNQQIQFNYIFKTLN